jgi:GNAT superfamily N-acetyltransferase
MYAVVYFNRKTFYNVLKNTRVDNKTYKELNRIRKLPPIGLLRWIHIENQYRGKGFGKLFVKKFVKKCRKLSCRYLILEADVDRVQKDGFNLLNWYKRMGFNPIGRARQGGCHRIMFKKLYYN